MKILKGIRILAKHPLIIIPRLLTSLEDINRLVNKQLGKLDHNQQQSLFKLFNTHPGKYSKTIGIIKTNTLLLGSSAAEGGIFLQLSCINHSCRHNAQNTWNENIKKLTVYIFKNVEEGEEITITYLNNSQDCATRQQALKGLFNFIYSCELCSLPPILRQESNQYLKAISYLDDLISNLDRILNSPKICLNDAYILS